MTLNQKKKPKSPHRMRKTHVMRIICLKNCYLFLNFPNKRIIFQFLLLKLLNKRKKKKISFHSFFFPKGGKFQAYISCMHENIKSFQKWKLFDVIDSHRSSGVWRHSESGQKEILSIIKYNAIVIKVELYVVQTKDRT